MSFGDIRDDANEQEAQSSEAKRAMSIDGLMIAPKIVHFIYVADDSDEFPIVYYLAVKSARLRNPGFHILLHANKQPKGLFWKMAEPHAELVIRDVPQSVFGKDVDRIQHRVDILRLAILEQYGGIYLDLDTICLRSLEEFLIDKVVMGVQSGGGLCNAVIVAPKGHEFIKRWRDGYRDFHNQQWDDFSVKLPARLSVDHPHLIKIEAESVFFRPGFDHESLRDLFERPCEFPEAYLYHLWAYASREYLENISVRDIFEVNTTYNIAARDVIGADMDRIEGKIRQEEMERELRHSDKVTTVEVASVFENIYNTGAWGVGSGNGSMPDATIDYRLFLERFLVLNDIRSIVDVGCGDWQSSRFVNFGCASYVGFDVVESLVVENQRMFGSRNVKFCRMPAALDDVPKAELLIMKDVLQHLPDAQVCEFRDRLLPKYRYCLITNSWAAINYGRNVDIAVGEFRALDLKSAPYHFKGAYVNEVWNQWERIRTMLVTNCH